MTNVVDMKTRRQVVADISQRRVLSIKEVRERLHSDEMKRTSSKKALNGDPLNKVLARNLGRLVEARANGTSEQLKLIRRIFRAWKKELTLGSPEEQEDEGDHDSLLKKRARWVTLQREDQPAGLASHGKGFVRLAELIAEEAPLGMTKKASEADAILTLVSGTELSPDRSGSLQGNLGRQAALQRCLESLKQDVLASTPELPRYFRLVSEGGLFHEDMKCSGNGNHFEWDTSVFHEDRWSNLRPTMLGDHADIAEEGARIAGVLPNIALASVSIRSFHPAVPCPDHDNFQRFTSGSHAEAPRAELRELTWTWRIHLVLAPVGGVEAKNIQFCLIGTPNDDNPNTLDFSGWQWLPEGVAVDLGTTPDELLVRLARLDAELWLASGEDGRWLLADLEDDYDDLPDPRPLHLDQRNYVAIKLHPELGWEPIGPRLQLPPKSTIVGLLERHLRTAEIPERADTRLFEDVRRRVDVLERQLNIDGEG